jgi:hypothetical protein
METKMAYVLKSDDGNGARYVKSDTHVTFQIEEACAFAALADAELEAKRWRQRHFSRDFPGRVWVEEVA